MTGHFYAAATVDVLAMAFPSGFVLNAWSDTLAPVYPMTLRSTTGIWEKAPVASEPDEHGERQITDPGVRTAPYVVVSSRPIDALAAFRVDVAGETLA